MSFIHFNSYALAAGSHARDSSCAASHKWVEHKRGFVGRGKNAALDQGDRLLGRVFPLGLLVSAGR
jgi:hypothetical protein